VDALGIERMPASNTAIAVGAAVLNRVDGVFPDVDARHALSTAMAGLFMSAAEIGRVAVGADLAEAMGTLVPAVDADVLGTVGQLLAMNEGKDADEVDFATFASFFFQPGTEH
jgi:hypothetical protein